MFNIGTGREVSVLELYDLCRRAAGSTPRRFTLPRASASSSGASSIRRRAAAELGFMAMVELEDGLAGDLGLGSRVELSLTARSEGVSPRTRESNRAWITRSPLPMLSSAPGGSPPTSRERSPWPSSCCSS